MCSYSEPIGGRLERQEPIWMDKAKTQMQSGTGGESRFSSQKRLGAEETLARLPPGGRRIGAQNDLRLRFRHGFGFAAHDAETDVFRRCRAVRPRVGGTVGAAADHFAFAVAGEHPFGDVAAEVVNGLFVVFALTVEAADLF